MQMQKNWLMTGRETGVNAKHFQCEGRSNLALSKIRHRSYSPVPKSKKPNDISREVGSKLDNSTAVHITEEGHHRVLAM